MGRARAGLALSLTLLLAPVAGAAEGPSADDLVAVPEGSVWMGSDGDGVDERRAHRVTVPAFWIQRDKVTNADVAAFLSARGLQTAEGEDAYDLDDPDARIRQTGRAFRPVGGFERHPAVEVSWFGARDYCAWRGLRLPTEAEWERAARGDDRRRYPWGDEAPTPARAVYGRAYNATEPVGGRPDGASPFGVLDLLGNLREWTASEFLPYPYRSGGRHEQPGRTRRRVVRGASHDDPAGALRVTVRHFYDHAGTARGHHHVGFRCATSQDPRRDDSR